MTQTVPRSDVLRLQSSWSFSVADGRIVVSSPLSRQRIRITHSAAALETLTQLRRGIVVGSGEQSPGADQEPGYELLQTLSEVGAVVRRRPDDDLSALSGADLYDRQIRFLSYYESATESGLLFNSRLQNSTVVLTGLGGLGGWIALLLARVGVKRIIGIDPDCVELSNLHRQILYSTDDIGLPKIEAARRALSAADSTVRFEGHARWIRAADDVRPLLADADLVINAFPYIPSFAQAARATAEAAIASGVAALNLPMTHGIGPLTLPGRTACIQCAHPVLEERFKLAGLDAAAAPAWADAGYLAALAPRQAVTGGLAVWETVRYLSGMERPRTLDGVAHFDIAEYGRHQFVPVPRDPVCGLCGGAEMIPPRDHVARWTT